MVARTVPGPGLSNERMRRLGSRAIALPASRLSALAQRGDVVYRASVRTPVYRGAMDRVYLLASRPQSALGDRQAFEIGDQPRSGWPPSQLLLR
jgi:hypothetical protein